MEYAAAAAVTAIVVGSAIKGYSARAEGKAANNAATFEANQMQEQALEERASAQRDFLEQKRSAKLVESRALMLSAASGGAGDVTTTNILGDINAEGEYRALTALFNGEERAIGLETDAVTRRYEGREARSAGNIRAIGSVFDAGGSLFAKYGAGGYSSKR